MGTFLTEQELRDAVGLQDSSGDTALIAAEDEAIRLISDVGWYLGQPPGTLGDVTQRVNPGRCEFSRTIKIGLYGEPTGEVVVELRASRESFDAIPVDPSKIRVTGRTAEIIDSRASTAYEVSLAYQCGYTISTLPDRLKRAIVSIVATLYRSQSQASTGGITRVSGPRQTVSFSSEGSDRNRAVGSAREIAESVRRFC